MKIKLLLPLVLAAGLFPIPARAVVGYINYSFAPGFNVFGNFFANADTSANGQLTAGTPVGTALTKFDAGTGQYLPYSFFNGTTWSINYSFAAGEAGVLYTTTSFTGTMLGEVIFNPTIPARSPGNYLLGPGGVFDPPGSLGKFQDIIGRAPEEGESISRFDQPSQTFHTYQFLFGDWYDENMAWVTPPQLLVNEAAFFGLGAYGGSPGFLPAPVPEPGIATLLLIGGVLGRMLHRRP